MTDASAITDLDDIADWVCERIWTECDASAITESHHDDASAVVAALATEFLRERHVALSIDERTHVIERVIAATLGLGPIEALMHDPAVTEIMVNGPHAVFVERNGVIEPVPVRFIDDEHVRRVIDRILAPIGRRIDALSPIVDARLPDGSRVNAIIPPLAVDGSAVTIRRFCEVARSLDDLERLGAFDHRIRPCIEQLVSERLNVLVAGPTSSGKTTLLAAALQQSDVADRIVVIEDSAELPVKRDHLVRLEARPATFEAYGEIQLRDLLKNALRMRPDRLVIGEVRAHEAFDLIQALNTGHRGCWSTVHADGAHDALLRLESMAMMSGIALPHAVLRQQMARAFDAVIVVGRVASRRIVRSIERVAGITDDGDWVVDSLVAESTSR